MAKSVASSRLGRLGRLAALGTRVGGTIVARAANRIGGGDVTETQRKVALQLVATLGKMKGLAQKVGQAISMDVDHLPPEIREIIGKLQGQSEPLDAEAIAEAVEQDLGAPPSKLFAEFEPEPFAAASLGQVHRATLHDGRRVAVKVQYPGVAKALASDLKNVGAIVRTLGLMGERFNGEVYYDEVRAELGKEVDYRREAESCRRFAKLLERFPELVVPKVIDELTSEHVLTLEYLGGPALSEILKAPLALSAEQRYRIGCQLETALYGPFLVGGVMHADPHPGNFLVLPDGRLGVLDFGAVKELSDRFAKAHRQLYRDVLNGQLPDPISILLEAGFEINVPHADLEPLVQQVFQILRRPVATSSYDFAVDQMTPDLRVIARAHFKTFFGVRPPPEALLFFRAIFGSVQNLRALQAAGDFRTSFQKIADVAGI
jgi:predicted unusual protein kinase regulating ubiquinone biosynthesis (AarF/ABC1/UbiB family)